MEQVIGNAAISVDLELDRKSVASFRQQMQAIASSQARSASRSLRQEFGRLPQLSGLSKSAEAQRLKAQKELRSLTKTYQGEADSWKRLQSQKSSALSTSANRQKQIMADLSRDYDSKMRLQREATLAGNRAAEDYTRSANRMFANSVKAGTGLDQVHRKISSVAHTTRTSFLDGIYKAGSAISQLATRTGMLGFQMQLLGRMMSTAITLPVAIVGGGAIAVGVKNAAQLEKSMKGLAALRPNENIIGLFDRMVDLAKKSPVFEVESMMESIQGLAASGMGLAKIEALMHSMGNIGITTDTDPVEMTLALKALDEMQGKGKVSLEELRRQFGNSISGAMKLVSEGMGISVEELFEKVQKGMQGTEVIDALIKRGQWQDMLAGAEGGVRSLNSAWQNLKETVTIALGDQFRTEDYRVKPEITKSVQDLGKALVRLIESLSKAGVFEGAIRGLVNISEAIANTLDRFNALDAGTKKIILRMIGLAAVIGPVMMAISPLFSMIGMITNSVATFAIAIGSIATPAGAAALAVLGVTAAVATVFTVLMAKSSEFRTKMKSVFSEWVGLFDSKVMPALNNVWEQLVLFGRELNSLGIDWKTLGTTIGGFGKALLYTWSAVANSVAAGIYIIRVQIAYFIMLLKGAAIATRELFSMFAGITSFMEKSFMVAPWLSSLDTDLQAVSDSAGSAVDYLSKYGMKTDEVQGSSFQLSTALTGLSGMFSDNTSKALSLADAVDNLRAKMNSGTSATQSSIEANDTWKGAVLGVKEAVAANGLTLSDHTRKGLANRAALKAATQASRDKMFQDIKSGMPMQRAIDLHHKRVAALSKEYSKSKAAEKAARDYTTKLNGIPRDVATLLKMLGYKDVKAQLEKMHVQQFALQKGIPLPEAQRRWNKEQQINKYATGGAVFGRGTGTSDSIPALLSNQEHVWTAKEVKKAGGHGVLERLRQAALSGNLAQFASGGRVWPMPVDVSKTKIDKNWANAGMGPGGIVGSGGSGAPGRYQQMFAWISQKMGGKVRLTSGYRPGDPGYHGSGRATDLTFPDGSERRGGGLALRAFNLIKGTFMKSIKELIWDFAKGQAVWNGRNHFFTGGGAGPGTHNDHIHWAHDNGGPVYPGMVTGNYSGKSELMLNNSQAHALEDRIRGTDMDGATVNVYLDGELIRGIARVEIQNSNHSAISALKRGRRGGNSR